MKPKAKGMTRPGGESARRIHQPDGKGHERGYPSSATGDGQRNGRVGRSTASGNSITLDTLAHGIENEPILFADRLLTAAGDDNAPTLVADDDRRLTQTSAVVDKGVADGATDLLKEDLLGDPVPGLRPPQ